jgi:glycosyltransferase involved in cell wall biosynthesis
VGVTAAPAFGPAADRVSCIIPVYNEAMRIGGVLAAVVGHPLIAEVIVVDDASTDDSASIAGSFAGIRLIRQDRNRGKTSALHAGFQAAANPWFLLLDGDLIGLTADHITALVRPVLSGRADIAISLRENAPRPWRLIGLDYISGERAFAGKLVLDRLDEITTLPRFGFEVYLNRLVVERRYRIAIVHWRGVRSPYKNVKFGLLRGALADFRMIADMLRSATFAELLHQIRAMRQLRVTPDPAGGREG